MQEQLILTKLLKTHCQKVLRPINKNCFKYTNKNGMMEVLYLYISDKISVETATS